MSPFDALAARLAARAAVMAATWAEAHAERRRTADWWREPRLLWPLFTKG